MSEWIKDWITTTINTLGDLGPEKYFGIGFFMFLENLFPPIPSELIMPLAGVLVARGKMIFACAVLAGVLGTMLGALPWYYAGKLLGERRLSQWADRYGKWLGISGEDIAKSTRWFNKHGNKAVLFCRLVPGVRTLISIPAGIGNMPFVPFAVYSTIGTTAWVLLLTYAGYVLGDNYELVDKYFDPLSKIVLAILVMAFVVWIVDKQMKRRRTGGKTEE